LPSPLARIRVLRQVTTDRGEYHVVYPERTNTFAGFVHAGPGVAHDIGVLTAELEAALRTVVKATPEPESTFQNVPGVAVAIGERAGNDDRKL